MRTATGLRVGPRTLRGERAQGHLPPASPGEAAAAPVDDAMRADAPALDLAEVLQAVILRPPFAESVPGSRQPSGAQTIAAYKKLALERDSLMRTAPGLWLQRLVDCADGPDRVVERIEAVSRLHALWTEMPEILGLWPRLALAACLHLHAGERMQELEGQIADTRWCSKMLHRSGPDTLAARRVLALWAWSYGNARELNLANLGLGDQHAQRLQNPLLGMAQLRLVMLDNNRLSAAAEPHLIKLARLHPVLVGLTLDHQVDGAVPLRPLADILAQRAWDDGVNFSDLHTLNLISVTVDRAEIAWPLSLRLDNAASGSRVLAALEEEGHRLPALPGCRLRTAIAWRGRELADSVARIAYRGRRLRDLVIEVGGGSRPQDVQAVLGAGLHRLRELRRLRLSGFDWSTQALQRLRDEVQRLPSLLVLEIGTSSALFGEQAQILAELRAVFAARNACDGRFGHSAAESEAHIAALSGAFGVKLWSSWVHALTVAEGPEVSPFFSLDAAELAKPAATVLEQIRPALPVRLSSLRRLQRLRRWSAEA